MAQGKRPGGLTALAVLNFVFGGLGALGLLALFALMSLVEKGASASGAHISTGAIWAAILLGIVGAALMITSGVGYLGQKRFLGRTLGNSYAILSILSSVLSLVTLHQGFGFSTLIGLIYPVLTLILLNSTFKDDLVN
jgi:small-conductance mechanosensitive channel